MMGKRNAAFFKKVLKHEAFLYFLVTAATLLVLWRILSFLPTPDGKFRGFNLKYPLVDNRNDLYFYFAQFKALMEEDWFPFLGVASQRLGAPGGYHLGDFPLTEQLHFLMAVFFRLFTRDGIIACNLHYLFSFVLVTLASTWGFRKLGLSKEISFVTALLFSFLPYHFARAHHVFLANYWLMIPCVVFLLKLWERKPLLDLKSKWKYLLFAAILPSWHIYYAFFFVILVMVSGVTLSLLYRSQKHLFSALLVSSFVGVGFGVVLAPTFVEIAKQGKNPQTISRSPMEAELYALRLSSISLPRTDSRFGLYRKPRQNYYMIAAPTEGIDEYIGVTALVGLTILFFCLILPQVKENRLKYLAAMTFVIFIYGQSNSLGSLFNHFVVPYFRSIDRLSIMIAAFALTAFAMGFDRLKRQNKWSPVFTATLLAIILCHGLLDQIPKNPFSQPIRHVQIEKAFFQKVETRLKPNAAVLQLPYFPFPEMPPMFSLDSYEHFNGMIHTQTLRWSYASMRGRKDAEKMEAFSHSPLDIKAIQELGFDAIVVNRRGYGDLGMSVVKELKAKVGTPLLQSGDSQLLFFRFK